MIHCLLPFFILAAGAAAQTEPLAGETTEIVAWDFGTTGDRDCDNWPDGWTRCRAPAYPRYVDIEISHEDDALEGAKACLRIDLDGGAGRIDSPALAVHPQFSYLLTGRIKTVGLKHDAAYLTVAFCDREGKTLETYSSPPPSGNNVWTAVRIGPIAPVSPDVRQAVISLRLEPTGEADLSGAALFDAIALGRLPRMTLGTNRENNLFVEARDVEVSCRVSGFSSPQLPVQFELLDREGRVVAKHEQVAQREPASASGPVAGGAESEDTLSGEARWRPPLPGNGFYQVRARIAGRACSVMTQLAVMEPLARPADGEFGWSLARGDAEVPLRSLGNLLGQVGVHWVKFPLWYDEQDKQRAEQLARFAERLNVQHIRLVGVLDKPPPLVRQLFGAPDPLPVALLFAEPAVWQPAVDPILTRLALAVRWWQLGSDHDVSFVGLPDLHAKLSEVRTHLNRFGHDLNLGVAWRMLDEAPASKTPACSFLSYIADPAPTAGELAAYFAPRGEAALQRWVMLEPLSRQGYGLRAQTRDLVLRMLAAKQRGVQGIFLPDPFDADKGVMHPNGTPGPLLLPWRTVAALTAGAEYAGTLQLPGGSSNSVFVRGSEAVVALWNDRPQRETLPWSETMRQLDVWGQARAPAAAGEDRAVALIDVEDVPTFVLGVDPQLVRWNMAVQFEPAELESVFGEAQTVTCRFTNPFPQAVIGTVTLQVPEVWSVDARRIAFKLGPGESRRQTFRVLLGANASSGRQSVRLDFDFTADREYHFSVHRDLRVGLDDVEVQLNSHLDEHGNLVVEQQLSNESTRPVSFNCLLFVPERRRQRQVVFHLTQGRVTNTFVLPQGADLVGRTLWLRAEEIGGARILNYRLVARE